MREFTLGMHSDEMLNRFKPQYMAVFFITEDIQILKRAVRSKSYKIVLVGVGEMKLVITSYVFIIQN